MSSEEDLEAKKLKAEIKKLDAETQSLHRTWWRENAMILVAILSAVGSIMFGILKFVGEQSQLREFHVTKEVIMLVEQLNSKDRAKRQDAAILLSAYREHAVPLLLNKLNVVKDTGVRLGVEKALTLIAQVKSKLVAPPLRDQAKMVFEAVINRDKKKVVPLINHIHAMGSVGKFDDAAETVNMLRYFHQKLNCQDLTRQTHPSVEKNDRNDICRNINDACKKLGSPGC